jgi:hypothetical protein
MLFAASLFKTVRRVGRCQIDPDPASASRWKRHLGLTMNQDERGGEGIEITVKKGKKKRKWKKSETVRKLVGKKDVI